VKEIASHTSVATTSSVRCGIDFVFTKTIIVGLNGYVVFLLCDDVDDDVRLSLSLLMLTTSTTSKKYGWLSCVMRV
jgi:hypothetical protein